MNGITVQVQRGSFVVDWKAWQTDGSRSEASRKQRTILLKLLGKANHRTIDELIEDILKDRTTIYQTATNFLNWLRTTEHKPSTITVYRTLLPPFFKSVLGTENFNEQAFNLLAPSGDDYVTTTKKGLTVEDIRRIIEISGPRDRVLVGLLMSGMRIGEGVSRRLEDMEIQPQNFANIRIQASSTKKRRKRFVFITSECVQWIRDYHKSLRTQSKWILPGHKDNHLSKEAAYVAFKGSESTVGLFERIGLVDREDEIVSPHSFRVFASSIMRKSGLSEAWVDAITGQFGRLGAKANYLDWSEIQDAWYQKVHENLLLSKSSVPSQPLEKRIQDLEKLVMELKTRS